MHRKLNSTVRSNRCFQVGFTNRKIIFETPAKIKEAAESLGESGQWQADIADADHVSESAEGTAVESDPVVHESASAVSTASAVDQSVSIVAEAPPAEAELVELADVERKIAAAKVKLQEASSYGGGFDAGGKPVRHRKWTLKPSIIIPSAWDNFPLPRKRKLKKN